MVEKIYNLVEILDRDVVKNGDGVTPFQFKLSYSDGKIVDLKDKRVYVSFASTTTYLFKKKADVGKDGVISITLSDDDPIIEGNTEIEISVESSNGKSQKFPSQDGEHSAFVYISKSIESLNSRLISTYTLKQFSDKIDILMDDLDKKYADHLDNLKKDVGDYIDNSVEDKVDEIKDVAKDSMNASIKASEDSIAASLSAKNSVNATATKATTDINKVSTDATKNITDTSNTAVATVNAKGDAVLKTFAENGQVPKITADTGAPRYDLNSTKDLFAEISTWGNGFFTFYLSAGATNNATGSTSWIRGTVSTYGKNSNILAYDKDGAMYNVVCANGVWGAWDKTAMSSKTQNNKITEDNGNAKVYIKATMDVYEELLKLERGFYSIYINAGASNSPSMTVRGSVFVEAKAQWLSVQSVGSNGKVYSIHYTGSIWIGWLIAASESIAQIPKITNDDGASITLSQYDLLNTEDIKNFDGYVTNVANSPTTSNSGYFKRKYRSGYIEITYAPHSQKDVYRNAYNFAAKNWIGWEKIVNQSDLDKLISDTGWITYNTLNGVLANTAFKAAGENGYNCAYRKIVSSGITRLLLRVNISNITAETVIFAALPKNIVDNSQTGVARTNGANQKTVAVLRPSGDLSINVPSGFTVNAYVYHQFEWTL